MTLDEVMAAEQLTILEPFSGYTKCGKPTGKYYDSSDNPDKPRIMVEVKDGWFSTKFVPLILLEEIKTYQKGK